MKNNTNYKCHNCGASMSLGNFLKTLDPVLHKQYTMEKFKEGHAGKTFHTPAPKLEFQKPVFKKKRKVDLPKASEHPGAKDYLVKRGLDPDEFFYAAKFKKWANTQTRAFDNTQYDDARIVIPLYTEDGNLFGFQGRALGPSKVKYITIMLDDDIPKVYGLDKMDKSKTVYVVEGPFDSTFVDNAIAMCGADVSLDSLGIEDLVYVYDNEHETKRFVSVSRKLSSRGRNLSSSQTKSPKRTSMIWYLPVMM